MRFRKWLILAENNGMLPYWYDGEEDPVPQWGQHIPTYHAGLMKMHQRYPGFLDINPHEWYGQEGRQVWHSPDGELGYSLIPHEGKKEISGVYNHGGARRPGHGKYAVRRGFTHGGDLLHAFEGNDKFSLPHFYHRVIGAQPTGYYPFDPALAHPDWKYDEFGTPGLVRLEVPPEAHQDMQKWLRTDHNSSHDEFQDRLRHLKRMAMGSKMENNMHKKKQHKFNTENLSKEEVDRLVQGVDDIYFGGTDPNESVDPVEEPKRKSAKDKKQQ